MMANYRTQLMAAMHQDDTPDLTEVARILNDELGISDTSLKVRKLIVNVCDVITKKAACLAVAGIVGILKKIGRDGCVGVVAGRVMGPGGSAKLRRSVDIIVIVLALGLRLVVIVFMAFLTEPSIDMLIKFSRAGKSMFYGGVMGDTFGKVGRVLLQICVFINNVGVLNVYMIIIGIIRMYVHEGLWYLGTC